MPGYRDISSPRLAEDHVRPLPWPLRPSFAPQSVHHFTCRHSAATTVSSSRTHQAMLHEHSLNRLAGIVTREPIGYRAIGPDQRKPFGAISGAADTSDD